MTEPIVEAKAAEATSQAVRDACEALKPYVAPYLENQSRPQSPASASFISSEGEFMGAYVPKGDTK